MGKLNRLILKGKYIIINLVIMLIMSGLSELNGKEVEDKLKFETKGSYINDTIRISITIINQSEQNFYFQMTYWLMSGFGAAPNNVHLFNDPLFNNYIIFHEFNNDGFFDGAYSFPTFNKLPQLVSLSEGEEFKINFKYVNKDRKIHINVDSLEYQIRMSYINETDYQNLIYLSKTDFAYNYSSEINNLNIDLKFGKYIYIQPKKIKKISKCDSKLLYALFSKYLIAKGKMKIENGK